MPEEFDSVGSRFVLMSDTVRRGDEHSVGDSVRSLRGAPRLELRLAELRLLIGMPADCGGIEQNLRAKQCVDARRLRVPLVPADEHSDIRVAGLPDAKSMGSLMISVVLDV